MNYLISVVETWRVPTMTEADTLEAAFRKEPEYMVKKCVKTEKEVKQKGKVIEEYVMMQTTKVFNDVKDPINDIRPSYE